MQLHRITVVIHAILVWSGAEASAEDASSQNHRSLRASVNRYTDPATVELRAKFRTSAKRCPGAIDVPGHYFKSQSQEDAKLMHWFGDLCFGSYVEMGALDGVRYSNSYVFHRGLGWKGVMIEMMEHNYAGLIRNRPDELANIKAGVCDDPRTLHYFPGYRVGNRFSGVNGVGGIYEFTAQSFRDEWWGKDFSLDDPAVREVECDTFDNLLLKYVPQKQYFDFFSLDVEGAEFSVLKSVNWDRVGFGVILVEADEHNEFKNLAMRQLIESKGYVFLEDYERSYWFVNQHFHDIYTDLVY